VQWFSLESSPFFTDLVLFVKPIRTKLKEKKAKENSLTPISSTNSTTFGFQKIPPEKKYRPARCREGVYISTPYPYAL